MNIDGLYKGKKSRLYYIKEGKSALWESVEGDWWLLTQGSFSYHIPNTREKALLYYLRST